MHGSWHRMARAGLLVSVFAGCGDNGGRDRGANADSSVGAAGGAASERCRSQCALAAGDCQEQPLSAFRSFEETLTEWQARCPTAPARRPFLLVGRCEGGTKVLQIVGNYTSERRYFATDGTFIALATTTDVADQVCRGRGYWPEPLECEEARVTEVVCGESPWPVGSEI